MIKSNKKGFELIEILVIFAIIGLLSTLAVISINECRKKEYCKEKRITDTEKCEESYSRYLENKR